MLIKVSFLLPLLLVLLLNAIVIWIVPDSFESKSMLNFMLSILAYMIGVIQNSYSKYLADMWTDRRREKESNVKRSSSVKITMDEASPVVENFRSVVSKDSTKLIRDFIYSSLDVVPNGGPWLKITEEQDFYEHQLLLKRLEDIDLLSIESHEPNLVIGKLSEEFYAILRKNME